MPSETPYSLTWELDSLLPHPESDQFRQELDNYRAELQRLAERSDSLPAVDESPGPVAEWAAFLKAYEDIERRDTDLNAFVTCHAAADADNKHFQHVEGELAALRPQHERIMTNVQFALKQAGRDRLQRFITSDERLTENAFFLDQLLQNAGLRLPKEQELVAADLDVDGLHAWSRLYERISGELRVRVMERGEIVEKSPGQVQLDSAERAVRENNFYAANKAWSSIADTCADALNHIAGPRLTRYRRLGLRDHLDAPLRYNRMQRETLQAMWATITQRKSVLLKYLEKKARMLGLERLTWYDLQAPLPASIHGKTGSEQLDWDTACQTVIDTFAGFSSDFGDFARRAIAERWVEAENRQGKRQGGFCTGFPTKQQSRIFMTFTHSADSMSTLAHELGHAYHSHVLRDRPLFLQQYPMNLAETASTFAEAVLGEERLRQSGSSGEKLAILDQMLGDSVAFLMNIHTRFLFEDRFYRERAEGELTKDRMSELMLEAQKEAYLNSLHQDGWNPLFWASKLHFYISALPFYNFPYTFGHLLSLGTYALAVEAGDEFPAQYRKLLIATGCCETEDAVRSTLGYDLAATDFWHKSLDIVESRVERFVSLADA